MDKVNQKRSVEIDLVRGLAIILMVIGHTETAAQGFIYLFHMAVFFMASGYLYRESAADSVVSVKQYVIRKIKRLWVPYAVWTAIFSIFRNVFIDWNIYTTNPMILSEVESSKRSRSVTGSPFSNLIELTNFPSKESTVIKEDAYCVAQAPRPLVPSEDL